MTAPSRDKISALLDEGRNMAQSLYKQAVTTSQDGHQLSRRLTVLQMMAVRILALGSLNHELAGQVGDADDSVKDFFIAITGDLGVLREEFKDGKMEKLVPKNQHH